MTDIGYASQSETASQKGRCNATALRKAMRKVSLQYDAYMAPCGLKATQVSILACIQRASSPTMGELADELVLCRSALTHNLRPLERDGMVSIKPGRNDRRARIVQLTAKGSKRLEESIVYWQIAQDRFESAFGKRRAAALRAVLDEVRHTDF
ncbi:MarR family winged helix-turn-helix transcriptional regulator [Paraburkholderia solisilvae]|uniref:MarR family winged helix-turn-helix transcriptional regulator n=1 Tax=Paraburkholderia solisilvae TaxID=624376 RepID=UPI0015813F47|nr:MarR family winged helix-turn-helix transcriptional regulator [Paraburkholderia solisilvae]